jgi:hypothetical protein
MCVLPSPPPHYELPPPPPPLAAAAAVTAFFFGCCCWAWLPLGGRAGVPQVAHSGEKAQKMLRQTEQT